MRPEAIICVAMAAGVGMSVLWNHRFDIWCWWQGVKASRRMYPEARDSVLRAAYAKHYALNLIAKKYSVRAMGKIK